MIYIFCALYCEAAPLINKLGLKQRDCGIPFDCFTDGEEKYLLTLTGVGHTAAAAAAASVCTRFNAGSRDFFVNIGTCAGSQKGGIYRCNKITAQTTGRAYYPDMIISSDFGECEIISVSQPCSDRGMFESADGHIRVAEMEAEGFFAGVHYFAGPDRLALIKVVSDAGAEVTADTLRDVMEAAADRIVSFLERVSELINSESEPDPADGEENRRLAEGLCEALHCSVTMSGEVKQLLRYLLLEGCDIKALVDGMYREGDLPCRDRREGKKVIERLKERVL